MRRVKDEVLRLAYRKEIKWAEEITKQLEKDVKELSFFKSFESRKRLRKINKLSDMQYVIYCREAYDNAHSIC